jgi:hypothetical protein
MYVYIYICGYVYVYVYIYICICLNEYTHIIYIHIKVHILTLNVLNRDKNGGLKPVFAGVDVRSRQRLYIHLGVQE